MAVDSKSSPFGSSAVPPARKVWSVALPQPYRRYFVWAQVSVVFLFLELVLWAPTRSTRNTWAVITMITLLFLVLIDRPSLQLLGLRLPKTFGASVVLGISFAAIVFMVALVKSVGGQIPANETWP
ncbi:MAG: hypothetical protein WB566_03840, partial [Terriglobales bacterium]